MKINWSYKVNDNEVVNVELESLTNTAQDFDLTRRQIMDSVNKKAQIVIPTVKVEAK